jgi:hypothetical protein
MRTNVWALGTLRINKETLPFRNPPKPNIRYQAHQRVQRMPLANRECLDEALTRPGAGEISFM